MVRYRLSMLGRAQDHATGQDDSGTRSNIAQHDGWLTAKVVLVVRIVPCSFQDGVVGSSLGEAGLDTFDRFRWLFLAKMTTNLLLNVRIELTHRIFISLNLQSC